MCTYRLACEGRMHEWLRVQDCHTGSHQLPLQSIQRLVNDYQLQRPLRNPALPIGSCKRLRKGKRCWSWTDLTIQCLTSAKTCPPRMFRTFLKALVSLILWSLASAVRSEVNSPQSAQGTKRRGVRTCFVAFTRKKLGSTHRILLHMTRCKGSSVACFELQALRWSKDRRGDESCKTLSEGPRLVQNAGSYYSDGTWESQQVRVRSANYSTCAQYAALPTRAVPALNARSHYQERVRIHCIPHQEQFSGLAQFGLTAGNRTT